MTVSEPIAAQSRGSRLRRGVGAGLVFRITSAIAPILLVPLALNALGKSSYAVWMLATGLTSLFAFADLGLGNTIMSRLSALQAEPSQRERMRELLSGAYLTLCVIALGLWALLVGIITSGQWRDLLGIHEAGATDAWILAVTGTAFLLNVPLGLVHRTLFGMQMVHNSYYWQSVGPALSLALAVVLPLAWGEPLVFVVGVAAGPFLANLLSSCWYFSRGLSHIRPRFSLPSSHDLKDLLGSGTTFLVISVAMAVSVALDTLLLPHFVGLGQVADFSVVWRLYAQVGMVLSLISLPFWPIAADALARGDVDWVSRTLRRMQVINFMVMGLVAIAGVACGQLVLDLWLGGRIEADRLLLLGFSFWWLLQALTYPLFMVQNAAMAVRTQMWCWLAFLAITAMLKIAILARWENPNLLPWVSSAVYLVVLLPCAVGVTKRVLRAADSH